jgi:Mrp family chromosome partitioning ATPase
MTSADPNEPIDLLLRRFNAAIDPLDHGHLLEPTTVPGVPDEVVLACTRAMRRMPRDSIDEVAVTSSVRREGRSLIALGAALVQRNEFGRKTVLVELDLESPAVGEDLPGIAEVMRGEATMAECIVSAAPDLGVLPAGGVGNDGPKLLARFRSSSVMHELRRNGYFIVADLPPLPPFGSADKVIDLFSSVLFVVRAGKTPLDTVQAAVEGLDNPPVILLNGKKSAVPRWLRPLVGG